MRSRIPILALAALAWGQALPARAYTVQTGLTEGCHERITAEAFIAFLDDPAWAEVVVPDDDRWRKLAKPLDQWLLDEALIQEELPDAPLFVLFSVIVGVRDPDTHGRSASDLAMQRSIHADPRPEAQYVHALRAPQDDEPEGSQAAVRGTRASIRRSFFDSVAAWREASEAQISTAPVTLDFYDLFQVNVWQPGFLLGRTAHTLQDSFSHAIRSDAFDLREIVHVLNYVDAIYKTFDESRDGIAHSHHLDDCDASDVGALREAARSATEELLGAFLQTGAGDPAAIDDLLQQWVTLQEGCTFENDFCENASAVLTARKDPSDPVLPKWMSCSAGVEAGPSTWVSVVGICFLLVLATRLRRRCTVAVLCIALSSSPGVAQAEDQAAEDQAAEDQAAEDQAVEDQAAKDQAVKDEPAEVERSYRLEWHYKRVHWAEGLTAGVLGIAAIAIQFSPIDVGPHWTRNNAFDDWFQRRLIAPSEKQQRYAKASDALSATSSAFPVLVDLIGMTLIGDRNKDVGLQVFAIQAQAFAITGFVTGLVKLSGRERPCGQSADSASGSTECSDPNQSYFSGHTSLAFTGAGLTCVEQQHFRFFGRVGSPIACAGVLALATTTGVFRVVANRHWMSDVLTGAGVGLLTGWLMPWLMHYRHDLTKREHSKTRHLQYLAPYGDGGSVGLSAAGVF